MPITAKQLFQNALFFEKKKNFLKARTFYILCLKEERNAINAWLNLGILYSKNHKSNKAIYCYKKAIFLKPTIKGIYNLSLEYFLNKQYYSAIFYLQWAIRVEKNFIKGYILLTYCYGIIEKHDYAYMCLKKIINLDKSNFIALYTMSLFFINKNDFTNGKKYLESLKYYYPKNFKVQELEKELEKNSDVQEEK